MPANNLETDPDATESEFDDDNELLLDNLSEIDLHTIFEALRDRTQLPPRLTKFTDNFISRNNKLFFVDDKSLKEVSNYDSLLNEATKTHQEIGHVTAGILISELRQRFWHPDMVLVGQEAIRTCERCQLTLAPNIPSIPLQPIPPALPLQRWGIDFTGPILGYYLLNSIDYATGYTLSRLCLNTNHEPN
ncbi:putative tkp3 protein [Erysiphe neolycopersici]|uniref:Putative tkp3 protein n=1 Tax=Erysiphe neolycopersici TaxID=212602 RepID=A0A420HGZ0_9PEZI|nr:putative tkp3 protein [Erysiphe neolycopersici]